MTLSKLAAKQKTTDREQVRRPVSCQEDSRALVAARIAANGAGGKEHVQMRGSIPPHPQLDLADPIADDPAALRALTETTG